MWQRPNPAALLLAAATVAAASALTTPAKCTRMSAPGCCRSGSTRLPAGAMAKAGTDPQKHATACFDMCHVIVQCAGISIISTSSAERNGSTQFDPACGGADVCTDCRLYGEALTLHPFLPELWLTFSSSGDGGTGILDSASFVSGNPGQRYAKKSFSTPPAAPTTAVAAAAPGAPAGAPAAANPPPPPPPPPLEATQAPGTPSSSGLTPAQTALSAAGVAVVVVVGGAAHLKQTKSGGYIMERLPALRLPAWVTSPAAGIDTPGPAQMNLL